MCGAELSPERARANPPRVVVIVGPTAVGKTALSLRLAQRFNGEIISTDSRQIYRGMDIGTAKATASERAQAPHHLLDIVEPDEELTLAHYQELAGQAIEEVWLRGKLPMVVGGTGLYVRALTEGWTVPAVPPNLALRARLEERAVREGAQALHDLLVSVDPEAAERIDARNVRRVIRALEVHHETGTPISVLQRKHPPDYRLLYIGLTMPREALYERIDRRIDAMMEAGLEDEVRSLLACGYDLELPSMSGLGYRQLVAYIRGQLSRDEAVALIKRETRRFVRQQYNWFRLDDVRIHWFDVVNLDEASAEELVRAFLAEP
ncbi:MAG: tRNA (adenosine(37)-N6)-dimethylallyltransferase MiaA [Anaerolineae bacterium]